MFFLCASLKRSRGAIAPGGREIGGRRLEGVALCESAESIGLEAPPKLADSATEQCCGKCLPTIDVDSGTVWVSIICGCAT